jgi:hypothetical protein
MDSNSSSEVRVERTDAEAPAVVRVLLGLLLVTALVAAGLVYLTKGLVSLERAGDPPRAPLGQEPGRVPPEPRLQTEPFADIHRQRDEERRLLSSYGWVDERTGVVRIPIERAKELLVEKGLPVAEGASPSPGAVPSPAGARP